MDKLSTFDRRDFLKLIGLAGGIAVVAGPISTALAAGGGAAGAGGGGAGQGGYANGWVSFWHDEQDPVYESSELNGNEPQGWDRTSAERQLARLSRLVALDYYGNTTSSLRPLTEAESPNTPSNHLEELYYEKAEEALQKARTRASQQRGKTISHARVIGIGLRYMITTWRDGTYGRDGSATATFGTYEYGDWDQPLFYKNEMMPADMIASSRGIARGLQDANGWGEPSDIYGYAVAQGFATNRDGEWKRAEDDVLGRYTLIVIAIAEGEPLSPSGFLNVNKVLNI